MSEEDLQQTAEQAAVPPPPAAERPEIMIGAAFVGSFLIARVLKRIFD